MPYCQNCGIQVAQGLGFCPNCGVPVPLEQPLYDQQYSQQYPPQPQYYPSEPSSSVPILLVSIAVVAVIIVALVLVFLMGGGGGGGGGGKSITMSVDELQGDIEIDEEYDYQGYDRYYSFQFKSLNPGDTMNLKDTITEMDYDNSDDETFIELGDGPDFYFEGDLTDEFDMGDEVIITLHVIHDEWDEYRDGEECHFEYEFFEEMWDREDNEVENKVLPQSKIKHA